MDTVSKEQRSLNMSHIKGKDTSIEVKVRKYLFHHGFRYRINDKRLPGKPDIVLKKYKTVIFVNGCFWHRHINCEFSTIPKTNTEFWLKKFQKTMNHDRKVYHLLEQKGWHVIILWECDLRNEFNLVMNEVIYTLSSSIHQAGIKDHILPDHKIL